MSTMKQTQFPEFNIEFANLDLKFNKEIIKINERLENLTKEKEKFHEQLFKGIKGYFYKRQNLIILNKKDLKSKYKLNNLMKEIESSEYLLKNFQKSMNDFDDYTVLLKDTMHQIDLRTLLAYYEQLDKLLKDTISLVRLAFIYSEIDNEEKKDSLLENLGILIESNPVLIVQFIENKEIKEIAKNIALEYISRNNESKIENVILEINQLKKEIEEKIFSNEDTILVLEQLKQYKEILQELNKKLLILSNKKAMNNNKKERKRVPSYN